MTDSIQAAIERAEEAIRVAILHEAENERGFDNCKHNPCPIQAEARAAIRSLAEVAKLAGDQERQAKMMRAYHAPLDTIGAPSDEWPCNRASKMALALRESEARLGESRKGRAALVRGYGHGPHCGCHDDGEEPLSVECLQAHEDYGEHAHPFSDERCLPGSREVKHGD